VKRTSPLPLTLFEIAGAISGLHFRLAQREDMAELRRHCYPERPLRQFQEQFSRAMQQQMNGRCYYVVAEQTLTGTEGAGPPAPIIAGGQVVIYPHVAELADLAVTAVYRNQGIGTNLIAILTRIAGYAGQTNLEICVLAGNTGALALYERLGFQEDRRLQFPADSEAVIILHKELE
jgi:ribosomal protein S18 acetylase RimI-like enzyme